MLLQAVVLMLSRRPKSYCNRKDKRDVFYHSKTAAEGEEATAEKILNITVMHFVRRTYKRSICVCKVRVKQIFVVKNNSHFISNPMIFSFSKLKSIYKSHKA